MDSGNPSDISEEESQEQDEEEEEEDPQQQEGKEKTSEDTRVEGWGPAGPYLRDYLSLHAIEPNYLRDRPVV